MTDDEHWVSLEVIRAVEHYGAEVRRYYSRRPYSEERWAAIHEAKDQLYRVIEEECRLGRIGMKWPFELTTDE